MGDKGFPDQNDFFVLEEGGVCERGVVVGERHGNFGKGGVSNFEIVVVLEFGHQVFVDFLEEMAQFCSWIVHL